MGNLNIRIAGSGGQGVILCSIILADAALRTGKYAAQSQSYGPEARGGACKAEVVISDEAIDFPKVEDADFLLALTQASLEKYIKSSKPGSTVMIDDSLSIPVDENGKELTGYKFVKAPILNTAKTVLKKMMVANIVACGVINKYLGITDFDSLEEATLGNIPKGTEDINRFALREGDRIEL